jgi:transcriptional regulator with XRE-family HTH domain
MSGILGTKLRREREDLGLTQGALAKAVSLSSKFISLLELGKRMPSLETLSALAGFFKKEASYFLKEKEESFNILLKKEGIDEEAKKAIGKFKKFCEDYLYLEKLTGRRLEPAPLYFHTSPERMADEERLRLGLGDEPIRDVFSLIELSGLHVVRQPIPEASQISGIFIYLEEERAAFALVNRAQHLGQQILAAAHEYCHYLKDRSVGPMVDNADVLVDEYLPLYHPRERFAHSFASQFLVPPAKLYEVIAKDFDSKRLSFADVVYFRHYFGVSLQVILKALENLEYLSPSRIQEYQRLDSSGYEEVFLGKQAVKKWSAKKKGGVLLSGRFKSLALEAYQKKKITPERLFRFLRLNKKKAMSFPKTKTDVI